MVSEPAEGPRRTDVECRRIKTFLLEARLLAEEETANGVDEAVLKSVVTGIEKGLQEILKEQEQEWHYRQDYVKDENQDNVCCGASFSCAAKFCE